MAFPVHQSAFQENHIRFDVADCLLLPQALDILKKKTTQKNGKSLSMLRFIIHLPPLLKREVSNISISLSRIGFVTNGVEEQMTQASSFPQKDLTPTPCRFGVFYLGLVCCKEPVA